MTQIGPSFRETATSAARSQLDAAIEVADASRLAATPLDLVQQVGLIGTTIPAIDPAVAAVRDGDLERATQVATSVRDAINEVRDAGQVRLAALAGLVAGILLLLAVVSVRARRSRRQFALAAAADSSAAALTPAVPMITVQPGDLVSDRSSDSSEIASAPAAPAVPFGHGQTDEIPPPADGPLP